MAEVIARQFAIATARLFARDAGQGWSPRDYRPLASVAGSVVTALTGLQLDMESLAIDGVDRQTWAERNVASYAALLQRLMPASRRSSIGISELNGVTLGALLGNFSGKVLGQYDPAFGGDSPAIWMVDVNIDEFARRGRLDADEVALWVLVHELTHRAQFHGVPWFRERLIDVMTELFGVSTISPIDLVGEVFSRVRGLGSGDPVDLTTFFLPDRLRGVAQEATTIMTVAEGHAEWVMRQVSTEIIPHRDEFESVIDERRQATGVSRIMAQLSGIAAKRNQYSVGLRFFEAIAASGVSLERRVFASPDGLPTPSELADPHLWLRRMGVTGSVSLAARSH